MDEIKDFRNTKQFPGETGNRLDVILHQFERIKNIPGPLFGCGLLILASLSTFFHWEKTFILLIFFAMDWLLLEKLPAFEKSYGPAKPPVFLLAVARSAFILFPFWMAIPIQIFGTLLVIYGFWIEPHEISVTHQKIQSSKLPGNVSLRVLHLGDLHVERITKREVQLNRLISELKPDLILFSGDILNLSYLTDELAWKDGRSVISQWQAPYGVFFVRGSPAVDLENNYLELIENLPINILDNEQRTIEIGSSKIDIIGVQCTHRPYMDGVPLEQLVPSTPQYFTILLYHSPDLAPIAASKGVDMQLSGHTHGGQVRIPGFGALITGSLYGKKYEAGRYQLNGMTLYVSRGIGMEGAGAPRVRFFCKPEIILWEISGSS